jgi:sodium transport system permease protein
MTKLLLIQQLVIIASPALFMGVMLTTNVRKTFRLSWPSFRMWGFALLLPFVLHPLSVSLSEFLQQRNFFPKLPEPMQKELQAMMDLNQPLWLVLLAFAVAPAICEEIAFRGFILSGLGRSKRVWLAIGLSSLMFGLMHMIPQQVYNAALLGLVLGLLAVRSGSIFPSMLFHFLWNSLAVLRVRLGGLTTAEDIEQSPWHWLLDYESGQILYRWPLLLALALLGGFLLWRLAKGPISSEAIPNSGEDKEPSSDDEACFNREEPAPRSREQNPMATP